MSNIENSILTAIASFLDDHPETAFQRGYLSALLDMADKAELSDHDTVKSAKMIVCLK